MVKAICIVGKKAVMPFSGERLDQAIKARKTSQRQLGKKIGVEPSRVSEYKTGKRKPEIDTVEKIAEALDVPLDFLYQRVSHIEMLDLSSDEVALILDHRSGNKNALDDAMATKMDRPSGD